MSSPRLPVVFSAAARIDVEDILLHSARAHGEAQALAYEEAIDRALRDLASFPELGRSRPDLPLGCRSLPVERHVIIYRASDAGVTVVRILHQKMETRGRVEG